jgi:hypothetical protein
MGGLSFAAASEIMKMPQRRANTMGMDVYGINPTSEAGEYFRNNVLRRA